MGKGYWRRFLTIVFAMICGSGSAVQADLVPNVLMGTGFIAGDNIVYNGDYDEVFVRFDQDFYPVPNGDGPLINAHGSYSNSDVSLSASLQASTTGFTDSFDPVPTKRIGVEAIVSSAVLDKTTRSSDVFAFSEFSFEASYLVTSTRLYRLSYGLSLQGQGDAQLSIGGIGTYKFSSRQADAQYSMAQNCLVELQAGQTYGLTLWLNDASEVGRDLNPDSLPGMSASSSATASFHLESVPEPASLAMLGLGGLLGSLGIRRRRSP